MTFDVLLLLVTLLSIFDSKESHFLIILVKLTVLPCCVAYTLKLIYILVRTKCTVVPLTAIT